MNTETTTHQTGGTRRKEATMAPATILCPTHGEGCEVRAYGFEDFGATQVKVEACEDLKTQGWRGRWQMVARKSEASHLLPVPVAQQHQRGLVWFV